MQPSGFSCSKTLYYGPADAGANGQPAPFQKSEVLILFDGSESTGAAYGTGTRASVMADAVAKLVDAYQTRIDFGLMFFPDVASCGAGSRPGCCVGGPTVEMGSKQGAAIRTALASRSSPQGGSPMASALQAAAAVFQSRPYEGGNRQVLLVTDGQPGCGTADASVSSNPCQDAVRAMQVLANLVPPVRTLVLSPGPGDPMGKSDCLQPLAQPAPFVQGRDAAIKSDGFTTDDLASLESVLESTFVSGPLVQPSCEIVLSPEPVATSNYAVIVDNHIIPEDDYNGWRLQTSRIPGPDGGQFVLSVALRGEYCKRLQQFRYTEVVVNYDCLIIAR